MASPSAGSGSTEQASPLALGLAAICFAVGQAVQAANGNLEPGAIRWIVFSLLAGLGLLALGPRSPREQLKLEPVLLALAGAAVAWQFAQLLSTPPGIYLRLTGADQLFTFYAGLGVSAVLVGAGLSPSPWLGRWRPWLLVLAFLIVGRWLLRASPSPFIDVFVFQRDGAAALLKGANPYALRYPDIYGNSPFYGPGLSVDGQLKFGFPYFPFGLLLTLPAHALTGDYRWTQLMGMATAGLVIMELKPSPTARAMGALFLFSPRTFFVLEQGWTEPLGVGLLAAVAWVAVKRPRWLPSAVGCLIAFKQYTVFMIPLALLLLPREEWTPKGVGRYALKVAAPGLLVTLPFVLWSPRDFWFDVVQLQVLQPFRVEALSLLAWWNQQYHEQPSTLWPFAVTLGVLALAMWRLPRSLAGFVAGVVVVYLAFFATNKQAFCNYYYLVIGAAALAAALAAQRENPTESRAPSASA